MTHTAISLGATQWASQVTEIDYTLGTDETDATMTETARRTPRRYEAGSRMRREVLGAAHVDRSLGKVTRVLPADPGARHRVLLGRDLVARRTAAQTRSLLNIVMLTALNRSHELGVHVRGAVTQRRRRRSEIQEVLLQTAIYVGVPAALESFRVAEKVLTDCDRKCDAMAPSLPSHSSGSGNMGLPMVSRLVAAGHTVRGFDVAPEALSRLAGIGASGHPSAAAAAEGADAVILMLPNSAIVTSVIEGLMAAGVLASGTVVVDMSSSEPQSTRALAETLSGAGVDLVDAPVSGGVTGAVNGTLTIMVGGRDEPVERVLPLISAIGTPVRCGPVGAGHAVKALNNLLSATHLWATTEAMVAGVAFGLDPDVMLAVFNGSSGRSGSTENKWPNFVLSGTYDSGFGLALMLKDMKIALGLAESTGAPTSMSAQAVQLWSDAAAALPAGADHTAIAQWVASSTAAAGRPTAAPSPRPKVAPHDGAPER